jgi:hypothetical protein
MYKNYTTTCFYKDPTLTTSEDTQAVGQGQEFRGHPETRQLAKFAHEFDLFWPGGPRLWVFLQIETLQLGLGHVAGAIQERHDARLHSKGLERCQTLQH